MSDPIRFYFDFASPYAYFSVQAVERIAAEHGRPLEWRPILMWAVLKAHQIAPPMDSPAKRAYFLHDMTRSAAFYGLPYREPVKLPLSSHNAARLWHVLAARDEHAARAYGRDVFRTFFAEHRDISDQAVLVEIAARHGMSDTDAREAMTGPHGRALLEAEVARAIADNVCGSPYFLVDQEGFFGADRLPQLRWRLSPEGQAYARKGDAA
jgi:2-hydroxychromene-2-carboxylate isomerase